MVTWNLRKLNEVYADFWNGLHSCWPLNTCLGIIRNCMAVDCVEQLHGSWQIFACLGSLSGMLSQSFCFFFLNLNEIK